MNIRDRFEKCQSREGRHLNNVVFFNNYIYFNILFIHLQKLVFSETPGLNILRSCIYNLYDRVSSAE